MTSKSQTAWVAPTHWSLLYLDRSVSAWFLIGFTFQKNLAIILLSKNWPKHYLSVVEMYIAVICSFKYKML